MDELQKEEQRVRDQQALDYEDVRRQAYFRWFEISERLIIRGLLKRRSGWLLDAACSTGRLTKFFKKLTPKLVSVDFSFISLKVAARRNPGAYYVQADLSALPFKPVFSTIICLDALHCIPPAKRAEAVKRCSEVVLPEGVMLASLWNKRSFSRIFELPPEGRFKSGIYYQAMSEKNIRALFSQNGFKNLEISGLGFMLYFIRSIRFTSTLYRCLGWLTIPLEKLMTRFSPPWLKNKAMYFILIAGKADRKNNKLPACPGAGESESSHRDLLPSSQA